MKPEFRKKFSAVAFCMGLLCELYVMPSGYAFGWYHEKEIIAVGMVFFAISILSSMNIKKDALPFMLLGAYGMAAFRYQHSALILRVIFALLAGRDKDRDKTVAVFCAGNGFLLIYTGFLAALGIHNTLTLTGQYRSLDGELRWCFGFFHPNGFALFMFREFLLLLYVIFRYTEGKKKILLILADIMICGGFIILSGSKMAAAALIIVGILALGAAFIKKLIYDRLLFACAAGITFLQIAFVIIFAFVPFPRIRYGRDDTFLEKLNVLTTGRLLNTKRLFESAVPTLFGRRSGLVLSEMGFSNALYSEGVIFVALLALVSVLIAYLLYKERNRGGLLMLTGITGYALAESYLPYFNKNCLWLMCIGIGLYALKNGEKKVENK